MSWRYGIYDSAFDYKLWLLVFYFSFCSIENWGDSCFPYKNRLKVFEDWRCIFLIFTIYILILTLDTMSFFGFSYAWTNHFFNGCIRSDLSWICQYIDVKVGWMEIAWSLWIVDYHWLLHCFWSLLELVGRNYIWYISGINGDLLPFGIWYFLFNNFLWC